MSRDSVLECKRGKPIDTVTSKPPLSHRRRRQIHEISGLFSIPRSWKPAPAIPIRLASHLTSPFLVSIKYGILTQIHRFICKTFYHNRCHFNFGTKSAYDVVFSKIWLKTDSSVSTDNQRPKFKWCFLKKGWSSVFFGQFETDDQRYSLRTNDPWLQRTDAQLPMTNTI